MLLAVLAAAAAASEQQCADSTCAPVCYVGFASEGHVRVVPVDGGDSRRVAPLDSQAVDALAIDGERGAVLWVKDSSVFRAAGGSVVELVSVVQEATARWQLARPWPVRGLCIDEDTQTAFIAMHEDARTGRGFRVYSFNYSHDESDGDPPLVTDWCGQRRCGARSPLPSGGGLAKLGSRVYLSASAHVIKSIHGVDGGMQLRWFEAGAVTGTAGPVGELKGVSGAGLSAAQGHVWLTTVFEDRSELRRYDPAADTLTPVDVELPPTRTWSSDEMHDGTLRPTAPVAVPVSDGKYAVTNGTHLWTVAGSAQQLLYSMSPEGIAALGRRPEPAEARALAIGALTHFCTPAGVEIGVKLGTLIAERRRIATN
eukprot:TRINITY_DN36636_c0_g1_i1.p1 TRINITY_DN36636_c0_g1~~TRINITY_DN36636_c0_g1_i1.p1  ORF type:complete len:370 (+),score=105.53 TRINITY_DN36636_c0_g1_i1:62-1171(+)